MTSIPYYRTLITCFCLTLFAACKDQPADNNTTSSETQEFPVDFSIQASDSNLQLQFANYSLKPDSFTLLLNGREVDGHVQSERVLLISKDSISAGKNSLDFIFWRGDATDTVSKSYMNTLRIEYEIVNTYAHNRHYFTQGLFFDEKDNLVESTGLTGESKILFYKKAPGGFAPLDSIVNADHEFGEGTTLLNGQLIQLLWKNMYIRVYNKADHKHIRNIDYNKEGWGICTDGKSLYTSDGSSSIHTIDIGANPGRIIKSITVMDEHSMVSNINELEWVDGWIFANIWQTSLIYVIDPNTGAVIGKLDFLPVSIQETRMNPNIDVLNGIAYNKARQTLLVTGKYWSHFYEIRLKTGLPKPSL